MAYAPQDLSEELTVVTAYFNIGEFAKGDHDVVFTPNLYKEWLKAGIIVKCRPSAVFAVDLFAFVRFRPKNHNPQISWPEACVAIPPMKNMALEIGSLNSKISMARIVVVNIIIVMYKHDN